MFESHSHRSSIKDRLITDMKLVVADAEELLQATADQTNAKVVNLRARLEHNLKAVQSRLAEAQITLTDRTVEAFKAALQDVSEAADKAAEATREATQQAEEAVKKAAGPGKEAAKRAVESSREAAQKGAAAAKSAANKALDALVKITEKTKDIINK